MYYHQLDWSQGRVVSQRIFKPDGSLAEPVGHAACNARYTYSWRSKVPKGSFEPGNYSLGIRPPLKRGSTVDLLTDRKRYIEQIAETAAGSRPNGNGNPGQTRNYPTYDTGHRFTSMKWSGNPAFAERYMDGGSGRYLWMDGWWFPSGTVALTPGVTLPSEIPSRLPQGVSLPSVLQRQDKINLMFHSMDPGKRRAQIGETLISLMRGDLPTILKNVKNGIRDYKRAYRYAGSEHLNVQFGWLPLVADIQSAISVLADIDSLIYDGSERRRRSYRWQTQFAQPTGTLSQALTRGPFKVENRISQDLIYHSKFVTSVIASCDVRLSARLTPVARRTIAANDFLSQAGDVAQQLGVWYPALGWDLLPYSWLVDWATNIGRSIDNLSVYGSKPGQLNVDYAWATTKTVVHRRIDVPSSVQGPYFKVRGPSTDLTVVKDRVQGTPFWFGVSFDGLNAWQMGILAALGLAKAR